MDVSAFFYELPTAGVRRAKEKKLDFEVGASEEAGVLEVSALRLGGRSCVPWRKQSRKTFRVWPSLLRRTMSSKKERNRNCEHRVCFESASSMMNHLSVKSCISSVTKNLCLSFTPQSESPEENTNALQRERNKDHGRRAVVGLSEATWEVSLVNLTGFRIC